LKKLWTAAAVTAVAAMTMAFAAGAQASVTIGQLAPNGAPALCEAQADILQVTHSSGAGWEVPDAGVITSWSTNDSAFVAGQQLTFKLFKSTSGIDAYNVLAHDTQTLHSGLNTFKVHIPVKGGEVIGLNSANASATVPNVCEFAAGDENNDIILGYAGNAADGAKIGPSTGTGKALRVNVSATFLAAPDINTPGHVSLGSIRGGGHVTLEGNHFEEVEGVTFGGVAAKSFTVKDEHHVEAVAPAGKSLGGVAAAVTTPAGTATSTPFFFYSGCKVPRLTGKTVAAAKRGLRAAGCRLGRVARVRGRHGKVVKQSPKPGKVLAQGSKVSVKVGR
jgi:PASTA domain